MIKEEIIDIMKKIEKISFELGYPITENDYIIEDMGCPHLQPKKLKNGYAAIYMFIREYGGGFKFLKIGKANANSNARFCSQHYGFNAPSTLSKSICSDKEFIGIGVSNDNVKDWLLNNTHRINIYIKSDCGKAATELIEAILHYKYRPRFEGNIW